jgi:hypothetical protein
VEHERHSLETTAPSGLFGFAGRIFIRLEIGPGDAVRAMTYWRRGPEDR